MFRSSTLRTYGAAAATMVVTATTMGIAAPAAAVGATADAVPVDILACRSTPLSAIAKGTNVPGTPQRCVDAQIAGQRGAATVAGIRFEAVDAEGTTTRTALSAAQAGANSSTTVQATTHTGAAQASAKSAKLVVGKTVIQLGGMTSTATISCTYSPAGARWSYSAKSTVQSVKVNGRAVRLRNGATSIKVSGGTLHLNRSVKTGAGVVQQAAMLTTSSAQITFGESAAAIAQTVGNPCRS
ncbi:MAG TPA: hypothetical protein VK453_26130 [Micromonosporaceae bacterium]|nr:hypothetical protein [Micromonosporaceae bacterium]